MKLPPNWERNKQSEKETHIRNPEHDEFIRITKLDRNKTKKIFNNEERRAYALHLCEKTGGITKSKKEIEMVDSRESASQVVTEFIEKNYEQS